MATVKKTKKPKTETTQPKAEEKKPEAKRILVRLRGGFSSGSG